MERGAKIATIILGIVAAGLFIFYLVLSNVNKQIPRPLEFPASNLSQSIFDSQNIKYSPNAAYTNRHYFYYSPYSVDIADAESAKVSDTGIVYKISDTMYFYITEFETGTNMESVIRNELPKAIMIDSNAEMTAIDNYVYDEGYLNGFKADYYIDCMTVTNGSRTASVYLTGYVMTITDSVYDHGHKMFLSVVTATSDTNTYASGKQILDSVVATYQTNGDTQARLLKEEQERIKAEERRKQEAIENGETYVPSTEGNISQENLIVSSDDSTTDFAANANSNAVSAGIGNSQGVVSTENSNIREDAYIDGTNRNNNAGEGQGDAANASIPQQKTKSMSLPEPYKAVTLFYYYTNTANNVDVVLESPDGQQYEPTSTAPGTVIFKLNTMDAGKWLIRISGDAGNDSMKLYSDAMSEVTQ